MFEWTDKQNGIDDVLAEDINNIAHAVMGLEENANKNVVDQTYTPDSENAQSGKAVAEAVTTEQKRADNTFANALKGSKSGSAILIDDISPVTHEMGVKVRGKNLLPYPFAYATFESYGVTFTDNKDGTITLNGKNNGTSQSNYNLFNRSDKLSFLKPNTNYYLSCNLDNILRSLRTVRADGSYNYYTYGNINFPPDETPDRLFIQVKKTDTTTYNNTVVKLQIEEGTAPTAYTPYVPDLTAVKVSRCGKNLTTPQQVYKGASLYSEEIFENKNCVRFSSATTIKNSPIAFKPNTQYTVSFDVKTILRSGQTTSGVDNVFCFFYDDGTRSVIQNIYTQTDWVHKVLTSTVGKTVVAVGLYNAEYRSYSYVDIDSFQLEEGSIATPHEPYQAQKYIPSADGTVSGVKSLYPTTTLMTDTEGAIIEAEYNRDINKAFAELQQAILSMGGNT